MMTPSHESKKALQDSEHFQSLIQHEGFKLLVAEAQKTLLRHWTLMLTIRPEDVQRAQGFIEGMNFVLEYANAQVAEGRLLLDSQEGDRRAAFESVRAAAAAQRERIGRRAGVGAASLDGD